jgi:hypothetical protein
LGLASTTGARNLANFGNRISLIRTPINPMSDSA